MRRGLRRGVAAAINASQELQDRPQRCTVHKKRGAERDLLASCKALEIKKTLAHRVAAKTKPAT